MIFRSCNDQNPGELTVTGSNPERCGQGGFMMFCKSSTKKGPWHNFKTDENHWTTPWFSKPCQSKRQIKKPLVSYLQTQGTVFENCPKCLIFLTLAFFINFCRFLTDLLTVSFRFSKLRQIGNFWQFPLIFVLSKLTADLSGNTV